MSPIRSGVPLSTQNNPSSISLSAFFAGRFDEWSLRNASFGHSRGLPTGSRQARHRTAERPGKRLADEKTFCRHRNTLPIGFDDRVASEIIADNRLGSGNLAGKLQGSLTVPNVAVAPALIHAVAGIWLFLPSMTPPKDVRWSAKAPGRNWNWFQRRNHGKAGLGSRSDPSRLRACRSADVDPLSESLCRSLHRGFSRA